MRIGLCLLLVMLVGCTTLQEVTPYSGPTATATICVVSHAAMKPGVLEAITEELAERGIAHRVIVGRYVKHHNSWQSSLTDGERDGCDAILRYVANWSWDIATYMYFASLWMTDSTDTTTSRPPTKRAPTEQVSSATGTPRRRTSPSAYGFG